MRCLALLLALMLPSIAAAGDEPPPPDPDLEHQRRVRSGWAVFATGVGVSATGLGVMIVGRGNGGELNTEAPAMAEARSAIGAGLLLGGLTTSLVGMVKLEQAWEGRGGKKTALSVSPSAVPSTTGLTLTVRR